jgi:hypothetical protein
MRSLRSYQKTLRVWTSNSSISFVLQFVFAKVTSSDLLPGGGALTVVSSLKEAHKEAFMNGGVQNPKTLFPNASKHEFITI